MTSRVAKSDEYLLGVEDVVTVVVLRHPEFSGDFLVPTSGSVQFPGAGTVQVADRTIDAVSRVLTDRLRSRLLNPEVSVSVKIPRVRRIYVYGDVRTAGIFDFKPGWTVAEALTEAGGLVPDLQRQDVSVIIEHWATKTKTVVSLDSVLARPTDSALVLHEGDVVHFQAIALVPIYVTGKVKTPGVYRMREGETDILSAIAQAGGVADDGTVSNVRIVHRAGRQQTVNLIGPLLKGDRTSLPLLSAGDMVVVPEQLNKVTILGYVNKPGTYPLLDAQTWRLSDAIGLANGADKRGSWAHVGLVRNVGGKVERHVYDFFKFVRKADLSQNPELVTGDVIYIPETNHADTPSILSALSSAAIIYNVIK